MKKELKIAARKEHVGEAVLFIEETLKQTSLDKKKIYKNVLAAEEMLVQMVENADSERSVVTIRISTQKKGARIDVSCKGTEWKLETLETLRSEVNLTELEDEQVSVISHMLLGALSENIKLRYSHGINYAELNIREKASEQNNTVLLAMIAGVLLGLLIRFLAPSGVASFIDVNVFLLGSSMFMNAIKMIVAPLVFFSIAESMTNFSDMKVFGRIGGKVIALYFCTTAIAIGVGFALFQLMHPGDPAQMSAVMAVAGVTETASVGMVSVRDMLVNIVPKNFIGAFASGDMLQIIFAAILLGLASGMLGEYSNGVQHFIKSANALFSQMANLILKALPLATLCFMGSTVLTADKDSMISQAYVLLVAHIALAVMIGIYGILLALGRVKPQRFFAKFKKPMLTAFTTASSSATVPVTMESLDRMGVSPKVYSFSIPLGATINMDGASICYVITMLFMMRIFSIPLDGGTMMSMFLSVMMLSIGTPGIPGSGIAMQAMLFAQFGIPAGAVGYVMPLIMLPDYARTMSNVTGDAVVTTIVARSEGLLDEEKFAAK